MMIIISRPQQQTPDRGRVDRFAVQHFENGFQFAPRQFTVLADGKDDTHALLLLAKGHAYTTPGFGTQAFRQEVVKGAR